jgi:hypothetical protein
MSRFIAGALAGVSHYCKPTLDKTMALKPTRQDYQSEQQNEDERVKKSREEVYSKTYNPKTGKFE